MIDYLYRITHIDNIPHILSFGITHQTSPNANPDYTDIGNASIIGKRHVATVVTVDNENLNLGNFIPFYFYVRMPMLYCIKNGFGVKQVNQEDIVYLVVEFKPIINDPERNSFFSDAHAVWRNAKFFGIRHIKSIDTILDCSAIHSNDWGFDNIIKERKQAEFLVDGDIPVEYIYAILCYNEKAKNRLEAMGVKCPVHVWRQAYY